MSEDFDFEEFKASFETFQDQHGMSETVDEEEAVYRLTEKGIRHILEVYERAKSGQDIEDIEEAMDIDPSEDHSEFRIYMAIGTMTGIFDKYDELEEMSKRLDGIELEMRNGE